MLIFNNYRNMRNIKDELKRIYRYINLGCGDIDYLTQQQHNLMKWFKSLSENEQEFCHKPYIKMQIILSTKMEMVSKQNARMTPRVSNSVSKFFMFPCCLEDKVLYDSRILD